MMPIPQQYLDGIDLFNEEKYFEAHEAWESVWMKSAGQERLFYQALIQAAAANHHLRKGNGVGASSLLSASLEKFSRLPDEFLGLNVRGFAQGLAGLRNEPEKILRISVSAAR